MPTSDAVSKPFLLASYWDLHTDRGPIHARATADIGRHYLTRKPLPPYQVMTSGNLRRLLSTGLPQWAHVDDPRQIPPTKRSDAWNLLCDELDEWNSLHPAGRLRVAKVLSRLGFWRTTAGLSLPQATDPRSLDHLRLEHLLCTACQITQRTDPQPAARARRILVGLAEDDRRPAGARLSAAINLLVHHARSDHSIPEMLRWKDVAQSIMANAPEGTLSNLMLSAYWRGVSFVPFHHSDHAQVERMLDLSENFARKAGKDVAQVRYLHLENILLVLMTRAKAAAAARNHLSAERYLRALVRHDPLDPTSHVRLADFLVIGGRQAQARDSYKIAARLGAPCTEYASAQAAGCIAG